MRPVGVCEAGLAGPDLAISARLQLCELAAALSRCPCRVMSGSWRRPALQLAPLRHLASARHRYTSLGHGGIAGMGLQVICTRSIKLRRCISARHSSRALVFAADGGHCFFGHNRRTAWRIQWLSWPGVNLPGHVASSSSGTSGYWNYFCCTLGAGPPALQPEVLDQRAHLDRVRVAGGGRALRRARLRRQVPGAPALGKRVRPPSVHPRPRRSARGVVEGSRAAPS